jgi:CO/xanthine dehydrogenase Mo-binding subunit
MTTEYQHNVVLSTTNYNVIGTRPIRPDGADKVTGRALYGADFNTSGLLHGKVLRSPHAHAIIKSIDTSEAEAMPGVLAVVTHKDFPQTADAIVDMGEEVTTLDWLRDNLLASKKALYKGHAIAAVAAANPHAAEEAVAKIKVEYEVLKPVLTAPEGMKASAPILHPGLKTEELGTKTDKVSNVASHFQHVKGDIAKGFANADVVLEREYNEPGLVGWVSSEAKFIRPQSSNGSADLGIDRLGRITNKSLRASWRCHCETEPGKVGSGGGAKASPGDSGENPQGLKTQEGIGLLAELIALSVVTDCYPD